MITVVDDLSAKGVNIPNGIFNVNKTDYETPELFLGQPGGLLNTIHRPYPRLFELFEELKAKDWKHNEFDYSKCIPEFKTCSPSISRMMIRTLAWQWEGDSTAARGISDILLPMCSATETRVGYTRIADNENLHGLTYSEIVRGSFEDPDVILNEILAVRESHGRMIVVAEIFDRARVASLDWQLHGVRTEEIENALVLMLCGIYLLERVQFMASFAVTFGICELGIFEPAGSAVQIIARDEYTNHVPFAEEVLRIVLSTSWGKRAFNAVRVKIIEATVELLQNEKQWVMYLHSDGDELPGVPKDKLIDWSLFNGRAVCQTLGITEDVEKKLGHILPSKLPLAYMKDWIDMSTNQASPQEHDSNQYLFNVVSKDISTKEISVDMEYDF